MPGSIPPFKPVPRRRMAEDVAEQLRERILAGAFQPGQRLPGERELAESFGVNRTTVREALRALEQQRLLEIHHGDGAMVLDVQVSAGLDLLAYLVRIDGQLDLSLLGDILEARRIYGVELARLAALRASEGDLETLELYLGMMRSQKKDIGRFQELDWAFFETLARAAHNRVLLLILNTVRPIYLQHQELFAPLYRDRAGIVRLHAQLLKRLRAGDAEGAAEIMGRFLDLGLLSFDADDEPSPS
jgi:GntR family transcriptional regulator, transcriptional repressor for pyruvate dehydrogenase complex